MPGDDSPRYSAFWPVAIVLAALAISVVTENVQTIGRINEANTQFKQIAPNVPKAKEVHDRFLALLSDLAKSSEKDPNALQVMRTAMQSQDVLRLALQAGIIHQRDTSGTPDTNAAPANP